tara:strand:+ start:902 stop:1063 length:162 start_codon:yes stop_codon:yes gene_type:complete
MYGFMNQAIEPKKKLQEFIKSRDLIKTGLFDDIPDIPEFTVDTRAKALRGVAP